MNDRNNCNNVVRTPPRNNYSAPHTPIASAKRPRSSLEKPTMRGKTPNKTSQTPSDGSKNDPSSHLSPMHPPRPLKSHDEAQDEAHGEEIEMRTVSEEASPASSTSSSSSSWVGRKVDALFSPVLSFLNASNSHEEGAESEKTAETATAATATTATTNEEVAAITDEDVNMEYEDTVEEEEEEEFAVEEEEKEDTYGTLEQDPSSSFEEEEFNPYLFIKTLPPYALVKHMSPPIGLPPKSSPHKLTLVLDLDETLVHCTVEDIHGADLVFPVVFHGAEYKVHVRLRPFLFEFLEAVSKRFEVVVFTASQQVYADELLNRIDPGMYHLTPVLTILSLPETRPSCFPLPGMLTSHIILN